ncbi:MAG: polysaccharide deacetylase family protein [Chitinophagaceae bacterium]|nr:polysaccharide deacetylase family protein [Chitinophagaceae bacterium]
MAKSIVLIIHEVENGQMFEKILVALKARYTLVSISELEDLLLHNREFENVCHISFDDGHRSFYTKVFPMLRKHQVPVSLFVSPLVISSGSNYWFQEIEGYNEHVLKSLLSRHLNITIGAISKFSISAIFKCLPAGTISEIIEQYRQQTGCGPKAAQNINTDQLKEMETSGLVAIGAHTINHPVLKSQDDNSSRYEITESIKQLESILGHRVKYFAYPNGRPGLDFGEREINCLLENDITLAFSTALGHLSDKISPLCIPRMGFARMGLSPFNPFIYFRLNAGKKWINIKAFGKSSEEKVRRKVKSALGI